MTSKAKHGKLKYLGLAFAVLLFLVGGVQSARGQQAQWEKEWEKTIAAAKKEGKLVYHSGSTSEAFFRAFQKKYPEIKAIRMLTRGGSAAAQRLMAERRAGLYASDVLVIGGTSGSMLATSGVLEPIEPNLILPEILDRSKWLGGKHLYVGKVSGYLFVFAAIPRPFIGYNSELVKSTDLKSYWDLLKPKWKGKIVSLDTSEARGGAGSSFRFLYYNPKIGPDLIRRLLGEMELTYSRDGRQITDWLASGKFALSVFTFPSRTGLHIAKEQGLPVDWFPGQHFKEGVPFSGGANNVAIVTRAPHPNAAKLFVNWLLSREGQITAQKLGASGGEGVESLRIDIPKDDVPPAYRRRKGIDYFYTDKPEWMDMNPIAKLIRDVRRKQSR